MRTIYGAAGSLIALLGWISHSFQIFFLGAEFTKVFANAYGAGIEPAPYAEKTAGQPPSQKKKQ